MSELSTQIAVLETQMKNIAKQVDEGFSLNSEQHQEMVALFERAIEKKADKEKVDALADNQKWLVRLVIGIVVTAVIGILIKGTL